MSRTKDYLMDYEAHTFGGDCNEGCLVCALEKAAQATA